MKVNGSHKNMVSRRMVLSCIVSKVRVSRSSEDKRFFLTNAILDPMKVHIHCLGAFNLDGGIGEASGDGIIRLDWGRWLGVAKFLQGNSNGDGSLTVVKHSANFSLSR